MWFEALSLLFLLVTILALFGLPSRLAAGAVRAAGVAFALPWLAVRWVWDAFERRRKRRAYEVIATFMPLLDGKDRALSYLETLVEGGIDPRRLEIALARHARLKRVVDTRREVRTLLAGVEKEAGLTELSARHEKVLAESEARLESLRFKEKTLSGLVHKFRTKYGI